MALGAAVAFTSCGKKLGQFSSDYFTTNPNPLEVVGEKVPATVTGQVPAKFFVKDAVVTVTPYLVFDGQEVASQAYTFQGEKVRGNAPVINYEYGGNVTIPVSFVYQPEMAKSELELAFAVTQGSKQYVLPRVKVADGVIATATLADAKSVQPALASDAFQRVINEKYAADIKFLINQANVRAGELNSDAMVELQKEIKAANADTSRVLNEINISSYASPDGGVKYNTTLSENREKSTKDYVNKQLKKDKITEFGELTSQFTPQDWEGFQTLVAQSNIQDKELILKVLDLYKDPEQRETEIRNLSVVFEQLAEQILPQLRYSRITASIDVVGKSDEQIKQAFASDPSSLSVEELLYCATLTDDNAQREQIYAAAAKLYPEDYRTWNDLGLAQYVNGKYSDAKTSFDKAASIAPSSSEAKMNQGLVELLNNNYSEANKLFGSAAGVSELGDALGVYYLKQGDNAAAARAFGNSNTNNAALAQILTKDYSSAQKTLSNITNADATTYYLQAILAARTNNESSVLSSLSKAINLDSSLASKAASDLEFSNFNLSSLIK
jgi:outer membrane protein OmpA-like peptidoglycan-associated protein